MSLLQACFFEHLYDDPTLSIHTGAEQVWLLVVVAFWADLTECVAHFVTSPPLNNKIVAY